MYRGDSYDHGFSKEKWSTLKQSCRTVMVKTAESRGTVYYSDLLDKVCMATGIRLQSNEPRFFHLLGEIGKEAFEKTGCIVTAVVVRKIGNRPGSGFHRLAKSLGRQGDNEDDDVYWAAELQRVHQYRWGE